MKKIYKTPITETVNVRLYSSVLDDDTSRYGNWSQGAAGGDDPGWGDAKENNFGFDDDAFGDIWGSEDDDTKDLWGDN